MATKEEYEKLILKAKVYGVAKLSKPEIEMLQRAAKQAGSLGNQVRDLFQ